MIKKNLIIGKSSQLSKYYQAYFDSQGIAYVVVSAKDALSVTACAKYSWEEVYLCFGESRKNISNLSQYFDINYKLTKKYIDLLKTKASAIYVYSTCELWNEHSGPITLDTLRYGLYIVETKIGSIFVAKFKRIFECIYTISF